MLNIKLLQSWLASWGKTTCIHYIPLPLSGSQVKVLLIQLSPCLASYKIWNYSSSDCSPYLAGCG